MDAYAIFFYLISAFILGTGILAVTASNIFRSAIWLLFSLIGIAGIFIMMQLEFVAAVQIVVYVGGIVVLIIFSIFLTQQVGINMPKPTWGRIGFSAFAALFGFLFIAHLIYHNVYSPSIATTADYSVAGIGLQMLNTGAGGYVLPFEVVSILLLAAMIGAIVIAIKPNVEEK